MRIQIVFRLASILVLSAARGSRGSGKGSGDIKKPIINLFYAVVIFVFLTLLMFSMIQNIEVSLVHVLYGQAMIFFPSFLTFLALMYSLTFQFTQSLDSASTDLINWLPIRPIYYILASSLSTLFFVSPFFAAIIGASFGAAIYVKALDLFLLSSMLGLIGIFLGAFVLESVRALMSGTSKPLGGRGRAALYLRLVLSFILMAFFYTVFNTESLFKVIGWFSGNVNKAWFVPLLWPSLVIISYMKGDIIGVIGYSSLSLATVVLALVVSTRLRIQYWAPAPVSYILKSSGFTSTRKGFLGLLGFSVPESALIWKDVRSIVRRREMWRLIFMPLMVIFYSFSQGDLMTIWDPTLSSLERTWEVVGLGFVAMLMALYLAIASISQEGDAFDSLKLSPLDAVQVTKAKVSASLVLPFFLYLGTIGILCSIHPSLEILLAFILVGALLVVEAGLCGLIVSARYPTFKGMYQALFFSPFGLLISMILLVVTGGLTLAPLFLSITRPNLGLGLLQATLISVIIASVFCLLLFRSGVKMVDRVFNDELS